MRPACLVCHLAGGHDIVHASGEAYPNRHPRANLVDGFETRRRGDRTRHYVNLSNGLEALPGLIADGASWSFLRLQSTTVERKDWVKLFLRDLSDDLLMHLALGWSCVLHDRGTRRPLSKTVYYAVPLVRYVLDRRWHGREATEAWTQTRHGGRGVNAAAYFSQVYHDLLVHTDRDRGQVKRRLDYFRTFVPPGQVGRGVDLVGASCATDHDGDRAFYADLARTTLSSL